MYDIVMMYQGKRVKRTYSNDGEMIREVPVKSSTPLTSAEKKDSLSVSHAAKSKNPKSRAWAKRVKKAKRKTVKKGKGICSEKQLKAALTLAKVKRLVGKY